MFSLIDTEFQIFVKRRKMPAREPLLSSSRLGSCSNASSIAAT
jgi:hypothetical protein